MLVQSNKQIKSVQLVQTLTYEYNEYVISLQLFPFALEQRVNVSVNLTSLMSYLTKERPCLRGPRIISFQSILTFVLLMENMSTAVPPPACAL